MKKTLTHPQIAVIAVTLAALLLVCGVYAMRPSKVRQSADLPAHTFYYTGPRKATGGTTYGNEDGTLARNP